MKEALFLILVPLALLVLMRRRRTEEPQTFDKQSHETKQKVYKTNFDIYLPATSDGCERFVETIEVEVFRNFGEEILTPESSEKIERIKKEALES
jgi:hypothetical protein